MWKKIILDIAETFDAWRVVPRMAMLAYGILVYRLYSWLTGIETYVQTQCDSNVLESLINSGVSLADAQAIACTVVAVVGGPTGAQTTFVTTIVGLSAAVFGLYTSTGRRWGRNERNRDDGDIQYKQQK